MRHYQLEIREHEEFGGNGIFIKNFRPYFEPGTSGLVVAHDLVEHPTKPHPDGYVDELQALGGTLAGRVATGYCNKFGRRINLEDLESDVRSLATVSLYKLDEFWVPHCRSRLQDSEDWEELLRTVRKGLLSAVNEFEDEDHDLIPAKYGFDIVSIAGWIAKGHHLFRKRFPSVYEALCTFDAIKEQCDKWLKAAEIGETATLSIEWSTCRVYLGEDWADY